MQEVNVLPVDRGRELREVVELRLILAPLVGGPPVLGQPFQVADGNAVGPANVRQLVGPAGTGQPVIQGVQVGLRDLDAERPNFSAAPSPDVECTG